jgi:hypothetical protein
MRTMLLISQVITGKFQLQHAADCLIMGKMQLP